MKLTKKLLSMLLTLAMLVVMAVPAFAADGNGTITITNAVANHKYTAYKILDLESYSGNLYSYKATTEWKEFVESDAIAGKYLDTNENGGVTWHKEVTCENDEDNHVHIDNCYKDADAAEFAKLAIAYVENSSSEMSGTFVTATGTTVTISNLELGYYLVDTTLGSLCSLGTTDLTAEISEKNAVPTIEKILGEESQESGGNTTSNTAEIGDKVKYKITVNAKAGAEDYVVHDKMSAGLTFDSSTLTVKVGSTTLVNGKDYNLTTNDTHNDTCNSCTFHIKFTETYLNSITTDTAIIIEYTATVNENAIVSAGTNKAKLDYGNVSSDDWTGGETTTTTLGFKIKKTDGSAVLSGAKFELYSAFTGGDKINLVLIDKANNKYRVATPAEVKEEGFVSAIITAGEATVVGLAKQDYYLEEIEAPAGYNKLSSRVKVELSTISDNSQIIEKVVVNQSGTELPSTGGVGTTMFYIGGGALFLGALVALITKKRMED